MRKTLRKILGVLALCITLIFVSACTFFEAESARSISRIYTVRDDDEGGFYIVIEYEGDNYPADRFFIEDAAEGKQGNGIESVTSRMSDDGFSTILTITYTDISRSPTEITIPNGTYIASIVTETDPVTNVVTMTINFSDGTPPVTLELQPGKDGKDGDRIKRVEYETDPETGDITLHFIYERYNEETGEWEEYEPEQEYPIVIPKGENGNGITHMELNYQSYSDLDNIYFDVYYSDGTVETISFPRASAWYTGAGEPGPMQYNIGDFYFDTANYAIWHKEFSGWVKLIDFSKYNEDDHYVYFYSNDEGGTRFSFTVTHGHTFTSAGLTLPRPEREGYRFLGWYTDADESNPNAGHFTDLTPVLSNLYLYARWEKLA